MPMKFDELLNEDLEQTLLETKKKSSFKERSESVSKKLDRGDSATRVGRRRLITNIFNRCKEAGVPASREEIQHYVEKKFDQWSANKEKQLARMEKKAKSLGFNPREYRLQKPFQSSGKSAKGQPEYEGRAFYFVAFVNKAVRHFAKVKGVELKN